MAQQAAPTTISQLLNKSNKRNKNGREKKSGTSGE